MAYKFKLVYVRGQSNISDYLSRHPKPATRDDRLCTVAEQYVNSIIRHAVPKAINLADVRTATQSDPTLQAVLTALQTADWRRASNDKQISQYYNIRHELCCNDERDILLRGSRICIPSALQAQCVNIAHSGHQGIVKVKSLLRQKIWFPGIDRMAEEVVQNCLACQANTPSTHKAEPLNMSPCPEAEWTDLSADFYGPLPTGEYLLVLIDEYSRFPIVEIIHSTSSAAVIPALDKIFALLGTPHIVKTDNAPPL